MRLLMRLRQIVVFTLLIAGTITFVTGLILYLMPKGRGATVFGLTKREWADYHTYASFIASGAAIIHVAVNWRAIKYYIKKLW